MNKLNFLSYAELQNAIDDDRTDNHYKIAGEHLLTALKDWPTGIKEPDELIKILKKEIKRALNFSNLADYSDSLSFTHDSWKKEAISSLLAIFDFERTETFDKNILLETIIERLTQHYCLQNPPS
jgi:hypothetical protein